MEKSIREKTLHGVFWSFLERMSLQFVNFAFAVSMARLLLPEEFGQVAMLAIFMALARSLIDSGFGQALIQKQDATPADESSVFYLNIGISMMLTLVLFVSAPWIALFYNTPVLVPLTRILSLNLVITAFGVVQTALLQKRIDFKLQTKISLTASVISGVTGVTLALNGFGVWSIVAQIMSNSLTQTLLLWFLNSWRPVLTFHWDSVLSMFGFGSKLLFSGILNTVFDNIYLVIVGRVFTPKALGFYSRARNLQMLPVGIITSTLNRVTFSVFSSVRKENDRLKRGVQKVVCGASLVNFPIMVGLFVVAPTLIVLLLTDKWLPCVPYFQLFCIIGLFHPLYSINLNVLAAQGHSDLLLRLEFISKGIQIVAIFVTYRWGITALILGQVASSLISYILSTYYTGKFLDYSFFNQIKDLFPIFVLAVLMGVCIRGAGGVISDGLFLRLSVQVGTGMFLFASFCHFAKLPSFMELEGIFQDKFKPYFSRGGK